MSYGGVVKWSRFILPHRLRFYLNLVLDFHWLLSISVDNRDLADAKITKKVQKKVSYCSTISKIDKKFLKPCKENPIHIPALLYDKFFPYRDIYQELPGTNNCTVISLLLNYNSLFVETLSPRMVSLFPTNICMHYKNNE